MKKYNFVTEKNIFTLLAIICWFLPIALYLNIGKFSFKTQGRTESFGIKISKQGNPDVFVFMAQNIFKINFFRKSELGKVLFMNLKNRENNYIIYSPCGKILYSY